MWERRKAAVFGRCRAFGAADYFEGNGWPGLPTTTDRLRAIPCEARFAEEDGGPWLEAKSWPSAPPCLYDAPTSGSLSPLLASRPERTERKLQVFHAAAARAEAARLYASHKERRRGTNSAHASPATSVGTPCLSLSYAASEASDHGSVHDMRHESTPAAAVASPLPSP